MTVCHPSPSGVNDQFMNTMDTTSGGGSGGTTNFGTFLFHTTGSGVLIAFGN